MCIRDSLYGEELKSEEVSHPFSCDDEYFLQMGCLLYTSYNEMRCCEEYGDDSYFDDDDDSNDPY